LITIDGLRADHLSCYGYHRPTSPYIDRLSEEGVLFREALAHSSHTPPSMATLVTAVTLRKHGLGSWGDSLAQGLRTMPQILKEEGYRNVFVTNNPFFDSGLHGFSRDFDAFISSAMDASQLTDKALESAGQDRNKPFFLWVHFMDVHEPIIPLPPYDTKYINDRFYDAKKKLPIVKDVLGAYGFRGIPRSLAAGKQENDNPDYYVALYDGAINTVDDQIRRLVEGLRAVFSDRDILVVVTADHGTLMGEHGYYFHHGSFLFESLLRVPLVMNGPGIVPSGKICDGPVSAHLDLWPTLFDILGIEGEVSREGVSLLPLIRREGRPEEFIISDEGYWVRAIRSGRWKLVYDKRWWGRYRLFDLADDPHEERDAARSHKEEYRLLKAQMDAYMRIVPPEETGPGGPPMDEETRQGLRSLGYAQ
jgi:arylsulfatase A-like enzyme